MEHRKVRRNNPEHRSEIEQVIEDAQKAIPAELEMPDSCKEALSSWMRDFLTDTDPSADKHLYKLYCNHKSWMHILVYDNSQSAKGNVNPSASRSASPAAGGREPTSSMSKSRGAPSRDNRAALPLGTPTGAAIASLTEPKAPDKPSYLSRAGSAVSGTLVQRTTSPGAIPTKLTTKGGISTAPAGESTKSPPNDSNLASSSDSPSGRNASAPIAGTGDALPQDVKNGTPDPSNGHLVSTEPNRTHPKRSYVSKALLVGACTLSAVGIGSYGHVSSAPAMPLEITRNPLLGSRLARGILATSLAIAASLRLSIPKRPSEGPDVPRPGSHRSGHRRVPSWFWIVVALVAIASTAGLLLVVRFYRRHFRTRQYTAWQVQKLEQLMQPLA